MNPTYSTFDTFTIGEINSDLTEQSNSGVVSASNQKDMAQGPSTPRREPKVVARLPRLGSKNHSIGSTSVGSAEDDKLQTIESAVKTNPGLATNESIINTKSSSKQRIDSAASPLHRNLQSQEPEVPTEASSNSGSSNDLELDKLQIFREGLRFDTFSETDSETDSLSQYARDTKPRLAIVPESRTSQPFIRPAKVGAASEADHWSDSWLLRLEAAVMPYSRLIVLAAVLTALGLTFLLLQGSPTAEVGDAIKPTPMADHLLKTSSLTGLEDEQEAIIVEAPSDTPIFASDNSVATRSSGPKGLPLPVSTPESYNTNVASTPSAGSVPRAQLAGNIMPIEPYRTTNQVMQLPAPVDTQTNGLPTNYPHTANASSQWPAASQGGTIR